MADGVRPKVEAASSGEATGAAGLGKSGEDSLPNYRDLFEPEPEKVQLRNIQVVGKHAIPAGADLQALLSLARVKLEATTLLLPTLFSIPVLLLCLQVPV